MNDQTNNIGCMGKVQFKTRVAAKTAVSNARIQPYRCDVCNMWHMGNHLTPIVTHTRNVTRLKPHQVLELLVDTE